MSGRATWCRHYNGTAQHKTCEAGVDYENVRDESQRPYRWPCTNPDAKTACEKRSGYTEEELRIEDAEVASSIERIVAARSAILEHASGRVGLSGTTTCPSCSGKLRYAIMENGHVHAQCETPDCTAWLE